MTDLAHLAPDELRALRPRVGTVLQERIDELLSDVAPAVLGVPGRPKTETRVRMECRRWCEDRGAVLIIDTEQNRPTRVTPGLSDLIVFWPAAGVWFVECKSEDGKQSMDQVEFQRASEIAGVVYVVARGVEDLEETERRLAA